MRRKVIVIGSGITGMVTAACLARDDFEVEIYEKHDQPGGRVRRFSSDNFTFDMGPQILSTPGVIETFFNHFHQANQFLPEFKRLDPAYRIFNTQGEVFDVPGERKGLETFFNSYIRSGNKKMLKYLERASSYFNEYIGEKNYLNEPSNTSFGFKHWLSGSHDSYVKKLFRDYHIVKVLQNQYPFVTPPISDKSAIKYALNYSFIQHGVLYPKGGIPVLVNAFARLLDNLNVPIHTSSSVDGFDIIDDRVAGIITHGKTFHADYFISAMDYKNTEQHLPKEYRNYSDNDWDEAKNTGSLFVFFLGVKKKIEKLAANSVIYNSAMDKKFQILDDLDVPILHVSCPSKLDGSLAPPGMETMIIRTWVPSRIEDTGRVREHYYEKSLKLLEEVCGEPLHELIAFKKTMAHTDFESEYGTYRGSAYGWISNQYRQNKRNKKITNTSLRNLFYAEFPVLAGLGISSAILGGELVAGELMRADSKTY